MSSETKCRTGVEVEDYKPRCKNESCGLLGKLGCVGKAWCKQFTTPTTSIPTAERAELKADRELYYNLAHERANEIVGLKQDICNRDEANRVMVGEVGKLKKENSELQADRDKLLNEIFCMEAEGVEFMPAVDRLKAINKVAHEVFKAMKV